MQIEDIRVHGNAVIPEFDHHFYTLTFGMRIEVQQRMLVEAQLREHTVEAGMGCIRHGSIVQIGTASVLKTNYQTRHTFCGIIGWPTLQPKAWPNSGMFCTTPLTRNSRGEW